MCVSRKHNMCICIVRALCMHFICLYVFVHIFACFTFIFVKPVSVTRVVRFSERVLNDHFEEAPMTRSQEQSKREDNTVATPSHQPSPLSLLYSLSVIMSNINPRHIYHTKHHHHRHDLPRQFSVTMVHTRRYLSHQFQSRCRIAKV